MFCNHCGKPNADDAIYCEFCGGKIEQTPSLKSEEPETVGNGPFGENPPKSEKRIEGEEKAKKAISYISKSSKKAAGSFSATLKKNKSLLIKGVIALGVLVAAIVTTIIVVKSITSKVSIEDYILKDLEYSGINGYGSVSGFENVKDIIDYEKLIRDLTDGGKKNNSYSVYELMDYVSVKPEDHQGINNLSNGDELRFIVSIDNEGINKEQVFKKNIKEKDEYVIKYTVSGLEEGIQIDLFDAIDCYIYDDSSYSNQDGIKLKTDYYKQYDNGIEVRNDDGLKIYGEDFSSKSVSVRRSNDKIVDSSTDTVKCKLNCEAGEFAEYGIVISSVESDVRVVKLSFADAESIAKADVSELTAKANEYARLNFETGRKLEKVKFYSAVGRNPMLVYFYKVSEGYNVVFFEGIKIRSDSGEIYNISDCKAYSVTSWLGGCTKFENIEKYEESKISKEAKSVEITIKDGE